MKTISKVTLFLEKYFTPKSRAIRTIKIIILLNAFVDFFDKIKSPV
jgi:hypothetical protein